MKYQTTMMAAIAAALFGVSSAAGCKIFHELLQEQVQDEDAMLIRVLDGLRTVCFGFFSKLGYPERFRRMLKFEINGEEACI
ncbi:hypothetical protein V2G26_013953 [Clonostachys chloroleuca]